jgi:hypothetical protein
LLTRSFAYRLDSKKLIVTVNTNELPEEIWSTVVRVTDCVGTDEARSVRVLLYLILVGGGRGGIWTRLRNYAHLVRRLPIPSGRPVRPAPKGCPLFAFLYDTPANTNNLLPVFLAAEKRGLKPNVLAGHSVDLIGKGVPVATCSVSVRALGAAASAKECLAALAAARRHFAAVLAEFERQTPEWMPVIRTASRGIAAELALAMVATVGLRRLYETWEPSSVISTSNMWPFDDAVFAEARRQGIPSFVVQHGITNHFWSPFVATRMLLWGSAFANELIKLGTPAEQLAVCGMPAADDIFVRHDGTTRGSSATSSSIVILSDTQNHGAYPGLYASYRELLGAVVAATPSIQWSVKLHPSEDSSFYRDLLDGRFPNFRILSKSVGLEEAVAQADVAATLWSTSGLEAMMMRKPLVVFDVEPLIYEYAWWPKSGGGTYASSAQSMLDFVRNASTDPEFLAAKVSSQNEFLAGNFANPGRASEAVLDTIEDVMNIPDSETSADPGLNRSECGRIENALHW